MNKAGLIDAVTPRLGDKRTASEAVEAVMDTIARAVASGDKVAITGFGVFERQERPARTARNPMTGATVKVKKTSVPKFRAGKEFKDVVSGARKLPKLPAARAGAAPAPARVTAKRSAAAAGHSMRPVDASTTGANRGPIKREPDPSRASAGKKAAGGKKTQSTAAAADKKAAPSKDAASKKAAPAKAAKVSKAARGQADAGAKASQSRSVDKAPASKKTAGASKSKGTEPAAKKAPTKKK